MNRLRELREEKGISMVEVSHQLGIPYTTYVNYEKGTREPNSEMLIKLSNFFGITIDYLLARDLRTNSNIIDIPGIEPPPKRKSPSVGMTEEQRRLFEQYNRLDGFGKSLVRSVIDHEAARIEAQQEQFEDMKQNKIVRLFCYAQPVSAGTGAHLDDEDGDILDVVMNMETARADFCVRVSGHSMEPEYKNGDILLIHAQPDIEEGEDGIFVIDGAGYVKEKGPDCLISKNYNYPDIFPEEGIEIKCLGKVIDVLDSHDIVK